MTTNQNEVLLWWNSGCDYNQGLSLFARIGKNQGMLRTFMHGNKNRYQDTLTYQLTKSVGFDWKNMAKPPAEPVKAFSPRVTVKPAANAEPPKNEESFFAEENINTFPKTMSRLVREYADLSNKRSQLHYKMTEISPDNTDENVSARAVLLETIKTYSDRLEYLYPFMEEYRKNSAVPDPAEIWPAAKPEPISEPELPNDIEGLKKLKKNLQTNNVKLRNRLKFQTLTKGAAAKPMPDGPKRKLIEKQIKAWEDLILKADEKLNEMYLNKT